MKKTFIKSEMAYNQGFLAPYADTFYIEDILKDDDLDLNMKSVFMINECKLSDTELKRFAIGYCKLMPQDKNLTDAIHSSELYMDDRITITELQKVPRHIMQTILSNGMDFESMPKLPLILYNIHNGDRMFKNYIHLITTGCAYHLQWNDNDKALRYLHSFVKEN